MAELPTLRTEIMMTTFMTPGRTWMPAFSIEMTKGDALASADDVPSRRRGSV